MSNFIRINLAPRPQTKRPKVKKSTYLLLNSQYLLLLYPKALIGVAYIYALEGYSYLTHMAYACLQ